MTLPDSGRSALASNVRRLRAKAGMTQKDLEDKAHTKMIKKLESNRSIPSVPVLGRIAEALGVTLEELFKGVGPTSALDSFMASRLGKSATVDELKQLSSIRIDGYDHTVVSYFIALGMLRAMDPK